MRCEQAEDWGFTLENNSASFFHKSLSEISSATAWCLANAPEQTNPTCQRRYYLRSKRKPFKKVKLAIQKHLYFKTDEVVCNPPSQSPNDFVLVIHHFCHSNTGSPEQRAVPCAFFHPALVEAILIPPA
jgi:hypothetical protein